MAHRVSHSWSDPVGVWIWVRKGQALATTEQGLGFTARREEIQRFGGASRRVVRTTSKQVDERTIAKVVMMEPGRGFGARKHDDVPGGQGWPSEI